jgi:hypothetical protein
MTPQLSYSGVCVCVCVCVCVAGRAVCSLLVSCFYSTLPHIYIYLNIYIHTHTGGNFISSDHQDVYYVDKDAQDGLLRAMRMKNGALAEKNVCICVCVCVCVFDFLKKKLPFYSSVTHALIYKHLRTYTHTHIQFTFQTPESINGNDLAYDVGPVGMEVCVSVCVCVCVCVCDL